MYQFASRKVYQDFDNTLLSVAEFYDSAVSNRPCRSAMAPEEAARLIREGASASFDPDVARAFLSMTQPPLPPSDATH